MFIQVYNSLLIDDIIGFGLIVIFMFSMPTNLILFSYGDFGVRHIFARQFDGREDNTCVKYELCGFVVDF